MNKNYQEKLKEDDFYSLLSVLGIISSLINIGIISSLIKHRYNK